MHHVIKQPQVNLNLSKSYDVWLSQTKKYILILVHFSSNPLKNPVLTEITEAFKINVTIFIKFILCNAKQWQG